jgi:hypothetical protein
MKHFYAIDTLEGNGWADVDGKLDPVPFPPDRYVVQAIPEEDKEMASKTTAFELKHFIEMKMGNTSSMFRVMKPFRKSNA